MTGLLTRMALDALQTERARAEAAEAQLLALRGVLEPFASLSWRLMPGAPESVSLANVPDDHAVNLSCKAGDLRALRAALSGGDT